MRGLLHRAFVLHGWILDEAVVHIDVAFKRKTWTVTDIFARNFMRVLQGRFAKGSITRSISELRNFGLYLLSTQLSLPSSPTALDRIPAPEPQEAGRHPTCCLRPRMNIQFSRRLRIRALDVTYSRNAVRATTRRQSPHCDTRSEVELRLR